MKIKEDHKIILYAVGAAVAFLLVDAVLDGIFDHKSFLQSLYDFSFHEIYFRSFVAVSLIISWVALSRVRKGQLEVEERYKNLVELSSDIISVVDKDGNQVFWNDAAYRVLERTPEEAIGKSFLLSIHPDDRERMLAARKQILESKSPVFDIENRYVSKSGKVFNFLHSIRILHDADGSVIGTQGIGRDITDRKRREEALTAALMRANEEKKKSEAVLAAIGDSLVILDPDYRIVYQNQVDTDIIGNHTGERCYAAFEGRDAVCEGCPAKRSFGDGQVHRSERTALTAAGIMHMDVTASPLRDASGNIIAVIEIVRNNTERKKAEERLKLFSVAMEEAMDGIQITDLEGKIVYSNKAVEEIYGFSPQELLGRHVNEMNADKSFAERVIIPQIRTSGRWTGEVVVLHKDGRTFPIWLTSSIVKDEQGNPISMVGIIRDITERKQAEAVLKQHHEELMKLVEERTRELTRANENLRREMVDRELMEQELLKAQKLESLGVLAGGIAHDFNNLLASIMGNISLAMLDLDAASPPYRQLDAAERASLRAQDLTRQLLTFSKGGAPVKRATDVRELIRESAGFVLRGSRVRHDLFFPEGLWLIDVDEGQISQVIHNLVINADHAMPAGGAISIRCENVTLDGDEGLPLRTGDYVKISITDNGIGIAPEHLAKIFDPYFTTKQKGSGLGLATSYSIIRKHGGHIAVESELGVGTTFTLYLPANRSGRTSARTDDIRLFTGTGKILLMDDEEEVRRTTSDVLKRLGYTVECAEDGAYAVELYEKEKTAGAPFDAVIMDLTVPRGMGGKDALIKLLQIDPSVKAIVSSGYSNDPIMADYLRYGFKGVVTKPYRIKDLGETLHMVLNGGETAA